MAGAAGAGAGAGSAAGSAAGSGAPSVRLCATAAVASGVEGTGPLAFALISGAPKCAGRTKLDRAGSDGERDLALEGGVAGPHHEVVGLLIDGHVLLDVFVETTVPVPERAVVPHLEQGLGEQPVALAVGRQLRVLAAGEEQHG